MQRALTFFLQSGDPERHLALTTGLSAAEVAREAAARGLQVSVLTPFYVAPEGPEGLLLGCGGLELGQIVRGAQVLVEALQRR